MPPDPTAALPPSSPLADFRRGVAATTRSVLFYVLFGSYLGIGALAHDLGFSLGWTLASTVLVWAAPAQVILMSALGSGATLFAAAIAVTLSAVRLLPMVVALLPLIRGPQVRTWQLVLPAHFTAISMWIEALRLLPDMPRPQRIGFCNGLGVGFMCSALMATLVGFHLAGSLPAALAAALLFLTPISFLLSISRSSIRLSDRLALALGLAIAPVLALAHVEFDLLWTGIAGGTLAYAVHRLREALR
jgi:predicted branched-subunit amino acid permease